MKGTMIEYDELMLELNGNLLFSIFTKTGSFSRSPAIIMMTLINRMLYIACMLFLNVL